ncbi:MAG: aminomethyl-transferring glycine dehydrogenase subunit GcvPB [Deltaproteobacteria bacterium]|nr:aminomethyl-transferring glycine dehydrogenase subunit GcvPB [Deltaproteobacteria bacterium]
MAEVGTSGLVFREPLIFERSRPGREGIRMPAAEVPAVDDDRAGPDIPVASRRTAPPRLPEVAEADVVRHFVRLSQWNLCVDSVMYPLGSCTMKYNPKVNEWAARLPGFSRLHPHTPAALAQGALELMWDLERRLCAICGFSRMTLQPSAGAQGELCGMLLVRACHTDRGNPRKKVLIPDTAHGTNPASCSLAGYLTVPVASGPDGLVDPAAVDKAMDADVAAIMITNPNTLGLFESHIAQVAEIVHARGGLVYGDGANLNALLGLARPGDLGIDVMQLNLHKTFSTPHGGGGPGSGPVGVVNTLEPYLPVPIVERASDGTFRLVEDRPKTIGRMRSFFGNFGVMVRAYTYLLAHGPAELRRVAEIAILNANYLLARLRKTFHVPQDRPCMHECVLSDRDLKNETGVTTMDVAKGLLDRGFHPPTVYFPLVVHGALMIEPTETESPETLDEFVEAIEAIVAQAHSKPDDLHHAPVRTPIGRADETRAARHPVLRWGGR